MEGFSQTREGKRETERKREIERKRELSTYFTKHINLMNNNISLM